MLVRTNGMGENSWLLIKHKDKYASKEDITEKDKSVLSGKTIEKMAASFKNYLGQQQESKRTCHKEISAQKISCEENC